MDSIKNNKQALPKLLPVGMLLLMMFSTSLLKAQLIMGQYEDEAPLRTWNLFGIATAASLGMGGVHYAHAVDNSAALTNPALLIELPQINLVINGSFSLAELYRYGPVNTGAVWSSENSRGGVYALDYGGVSFQKGRWALSLSGGMSDSFFRPSVHFQNPPGDSPYYSFDFSQSGHLKLFNLAVARKLTSRLSLGIGFNLVDGMLDKSIQDRWHTSNITILDAKELSLGGFFLNGGLLFRPGNQLALGLVFRTPYARKAESESRLSYQVPLTQTDILIQAEGNSRYSQPLVLGMGMDWHASPKIALAADITFFNWARYEAVYFDIDRVRNFRNIVTFSSGMEYREKVRLFKRHFEIPVWIGFNYDPQPMQNPNSCYLNASFGAGLHGSHLYLDISSRFGWEKGSSQGLKSRRITVSIGYKTRRNLDKTSSR